MSDLESSFRTFILQQEAIGAAISGRLYFDKIPDGVITPYVRAKTITDETSYHQQGVSVGKSMIQLDVFAESKSGCAVTATLIRTILAGYRGAMGTFRVVLFVRNVPSDWEELVRLFRKILEVEIRYA